jgi:carboxyl-terminal processing protease
VAENKQSMVTPIKQKGISYIVYFFTIALVALVGFVAGTRSSEFLGTLGFKAGAEALDLSSVEKTYQTLQQNYYGQLDTQKMIEGASRGLVSAAGDPYTVYMDAKESEEFNKDLTGNIGGGIGAEIGVRASQPTIIRVLPGNPAEKAGVKAGDVILGVNDQSAVNWTADKAVSEIRGEAGTTVKVTVARSNETKEFTITRQIVNNPSVQSSVQDGLGILTVSRFDQQTGTLARQAAESFKRQNVRGVVLDLRGNGGGYLDAAQEVAGLWLDNKIVVSERVGDKVTEELRSSSDPVLGDIPTVILVNGSSASASEIVAGALQDYKKATLVGEKTFGKGSVQKMLNLGGGATLKVTVARWFTPNGKNITKEGITPNQAVELTAADADVGKDTQLDAAKAKLNQ